MFKRFKEVRSNVGLTQTEFGKRIGVSRETIANIEGDRMQPKDIHIIAVSREFGISEDWIRNGTGEMYAPSTKAMRAASVADKYIHANSNAKNMLIDIISDMDEERLKLMIQEAKKIILELEEDQD